MKKIIYIYVLVPLVLFSGLLIITIFNNNIIGYLPPSLLSMYPLYPCWPANVESSNGPPGIGIKDIQFFNDFQHYHLGQAVDPSIKFSVSTFGINTPNLYVYHGNLSQMRLLLQHGQQREPELYVNQGNLTVWKDGGHLLKRGPYCRITAQYSIDQITQPPRLNSTGWYVFHADFGPVSDDKGASYGFYVTSP